MSNNDEGIEEKSTEEGVAEEEEASEAEEAAETEETAQEVEEKAIEEEKVEEEKEAREDIIEERIYTVPLSRAWISPRKERSPRAVRILRGFVDRHMKPESIVISEEVNERIWQRGIEKPPRKIRVRAVKDRDGRVSVQLAEGD